MAFFQLALAIDATISQLVPLIDTILFGFPQTPPSDHAPGLPSNAALVEKFDLTAAKALAAQLRDDVATGDRSKSGRAIVIDYANMVASREVAAHVQSTGLTTRGLFQAAQATSYQCGHNAAGWACMLRALELQFTDLPVNAPIP